MKTLTKLTYLIFAVFALVLLVLSPVAQAVSPAPDGGYPGGNTAEGQNALSSLATGGFNTAVGFLSLRSDTTGAFNTAIGAGALALNTAVDAESEPPASRATAAAGMSGPRRRRR